MRETKQKYLTGTLVDCWDNRFGFRTLPIRAIVIHTYAQAYEAYSPDKWADYCLLLLDDAGKGYNRVAWIHESNLEFVDDDYVKGQLLIEEYEDGRAPKYS